MQSFVFAGTMTMWTLLFCKREDITAEKSVKEGDGRTLGSDYVVSTHAVSDKHPGALPSCH
jgi:hypothetical protein